MRFVPHHPPEGSAGRCPFCAQWLPALGVACDCAGGLLPVQRSWDAAYAGVDYAHPWIDLIHDFKFRGRVERADLLARLAHRALPESLKFNRVIPIPLSPQRLSERGYNQAWELARRIARWLPRSGGAWHDVLMRRQSLTPQAGLSREERWRSLQGAMVVNPDHGAAIRGAHVLLVDDVMTTGATFQAAALALRAAGAAQIDVLAVARTP